MWYSLASTKAERASFVTNQWTRNSVTGTDVGTEEVLTAGMPLWSDVSQTSYNHTAAPRYSLNRKYLLSLVLSTDRLSMREWISSSTSTAQSRIWMSPLLLPFLAVRPWFSAASTKPGLMGKRAEENKLDRYPHINLVPFILETTGLHGPHARKFISYLMRDADNPPQAIRDTWSAIQSVLHSAISKQQLTAAVT